MKHAIIIHNPSAGNAERSEEELMEVVEKAGYVPEYVSVENDADWKNFKPGQEDVVFVVGGDGTVKKLAMRLLENRSETPLPIHLLPLGTANNIARTLQISTVLDRHAINLQRNSSGFDCGRISGLGEMDFFIESVGFGVFPELISEMKKMDKTVYPSEELNLALKVMLKIAKDIKPQQATIKADGLTIGGSFLMLEIMNIQFLGPNIPLAPGANPGDGYLDLVMIPGNCRQHLEKYLVDLIEGASETTGLEKWMKTLRVQKVQIKWDGDKVHVDDSLIDGYAGEYLELEIVPGALEFFHDV